MPEPLDRLTALGTTLGGPVRRRVLRHRRGLAALCAGLATIAAVQAVRPQPDPSILVWVAGHDLSAGLTLAAGDLRQVRVRRDLAPAAVDPRDLLGRVLARPLADGEPLSATSVLGPSPAQGYPGRRAIAVRLPDSELAGLIRVGDHLDLLASDPRTPSAATVLTSDAVVLALPAPSGSTGLTGVRAAGRLIVLAVTESALAQVAAAAGRDYLTVAWSR